MTTLEAIQRIVARQLDVGVADLAPTRPLEELGVDSLVMIEILFLLEDEFNVRMPLETVPVRTLLEIADLVDRLLASRCGLAKAAG